MVQSHKHHEPSFQRLRRSVAACSSQEPADPTVHTLHDIRRRGQIQIRIQKVRAILIQMPQCLTKPISVWRGTQRMGGVSAHTLRHSFCNQRVNRCNNILNSRVCLPSSVSPSDAPFDTSQKHMETRHEMKMTPLQDPAVISRDMLNASNTIRNQCLYAGTDRTGYIADASSPSLSRLPFLPQDRAQEYRILSMHAPHGHQICRPAHTLKTEPQGVNHQEERTGWNTYRPGHAIQRGERYGVSLAQSGDSPMSASRSRGQRLLLAHDMSNTGQSALSRLSSSPFLPDCPCCSASGAASSAFSMPMNNRV